MSATARAGAMISASRIAGLVLLGFAGAACGQIKIKVNPKQLVPLHQKQPVLLHMPAPLHQIGPAQTPAPEAAPSPAPSTAVPPGSGGTLIGSPLPPPPATPQASAASLKEDVVVEPAEVAVMSASLEDAQQVQQQAQSLGLSVTRRAVLHHLGLVVSVLRVPAGTSVAAALTQLRQAMPRAWLDANRRYVLDTGTADHSRRLPAQAQRCAQRARIGMIDTRVALGDPALKSARVTMRSFLPAGVAPAATDHGTAVASLLVGGDHGLMPRARLYAAAVFRSRDHGADTDAELVARALDWLVGQKVAAIELSIGGSRNQVLQAALLRVDKRGVAVIDAKLRPYALAKNARAAHPPRKVPCP